MQRDPGSPSRRCPGIVLSGCTGVRSVETLQTSGGCSESTRGIPVGTAPAWCPVSSQALGHPCPQAPGCLATPSSQSSSEKRAAPRTGSWQPLSCATKGTLPSIAATADARRSSSRQSRAIAGQRPPDGARAETRRVPGRRCAPGGWLLRVLSRSGRDRTPRSAAWAWAGVYARGAVRARVDVGVHVCVCVYGRGGCVRACVREDEGERAWESARERVRPGVTLRATAEPTGGQSGPD